jgi:conjugal transfer ATP-binding protein TraC
MTDYLLNLFTGGVPAHTGVQFMLFGTPRIDRFLQAIVDCTVDPEKVAPELREQAALLRRLAERRAEFYSRGALGPMYAGSNLRLRHFRGMMSVMVPFKDPLSETAQREILALRQQHISTLSSYHLYWRTWDADDLIDFAGTILNPHRMMRRDRPALTYDADRELRYQIVSPDTRIQIEEDRILFSSRRDRSDAMTAVGMSVRSYPTATTLNSMTQLLGSMTSTSISYPCPFLIVAGVQAPDFESEKQKVMMKSANSIRTAATDIARFLPHLKDVAADWELAQRAFDEGKGTVQMYHQLFLFCEPDKQPECEEAAARFGAKRFEIATDSLMQCQALPAPAG